MSAALEAGLPAASEVAFLRACLPTGEPGRDAFARWQAESGDPVAALRRRPEHRRRLLAPLYGAARHNGARPDPVLASVLRAAYAHEALRAEAMRPAYAWAMSALASADVPAVVVGGVALAEYVYPEPALRHCHDLDLLIAPADLDRAVSALGSPARRVGAEGRSRHESGVAVVVHTVAHHDPYFSTRASSPVATELAGAPAWMLDPVDTLIRVCSHRGRPGPGWAIDAWFVLHRHPELDWARALERARTGHVALGLLIRLRWLRRMLAAGVPEDFLGALAAVADADGPLTAEVLLHRARSEVGASALMRAVAAPGARARIAGRLLLPSAAYLRLGSARSPPGSRAGLGAGRIVRYMVSGLRTRRGGLRH